MLNHGITCMQQLDQNHTTSTSQLDTGHQLDTGTRTATRKNSEAKWLNERLNDDLAGITIFGIWAHKGSEISGGRSIGTGMRTEAPMILEGLGGKSSMIGKKKPCAVATFSSENSKLVLYVCHEQIVLSTNCYLIEKMKAPKRMFPPPHPYSPLW